MKEMHNRQNKIPQLRREWPRGAGAPARTGQREEIELRTLGVSGGMVYGLVADLLFATRIAKAAQHCHLAVHNFSEAAPLLEHVKAKRPSLIILDWDGREAEAYKVLKELGAIAEANKVPSIGYVSQSKIAVRDEAQRAGCHRVFLKTEFVKELDLILMRYVA